MAHEVFFDIPSRKLQREDVVFKIRKDGEKFGEIRISKGSIVWFPKNKTNGYKMGWKKFDEIMQEFAPRIEKKR